MNTILLMYYKEPLKHNITAPFLWRSNCKVTTAKLLISWPRSQSQEEPQSQSEPRSNQNPFCSMIACCFHYFLLYSTIMSEVLHHSNLPAGQTLVSIMLPLFQLFWFFAIEIIRRDNLWTTPEHLFQYKDAVFGFLPFSPFSSPLLSSNFRDLS